MSSSCMVEQGTSLFSMTWSNARPSGRSLIWLLIVVFCAIVDLSIAFSGFI